MHSYVNCTPFIHCSKSKCMTCKICQTTWSASTAAPTFARSTSGKVRKAQRRNLPRKEGGSVEAGQGIAPSLQRLYASLLEVKLGSMEYAQYAQYVEPHCNAKYAFPTLLMNTPRYSGDAAEIQWRYSGDTAEIQRV
jgi:hypothetical protein